MLAAWLYANATHSRDTRHLVAQSVSDAMPAELEKAISGSSLSPVVCAPVWTFNCRASAPCRCFGCFTIWSQASATRVLGGAANTAKDTGLLACVRQPCKHMTMAACRIARTAHLAPAGVGWHPRACVCGGGASIVRLLGGRHAVAEHTCFYVCCPGQTAPCQRAHYTQGCVCSYYRCVLLAGSARWTYRHTDMIVQLSILKDWFFCSTLTCTC